MEQSKKRLTIKDVAKVLSVTPATISKALRDSDDISVEMKKKVKKVTEELGYRPNLLARSLINNKSKILGIVLPDLRISFFSEAVRGMYEEANRKGYETIILVHDEHKENEKKKLEFLADIGADGILLNAVGGKSNYKLYKKLAGEGIKIVCWDRKIDGSDFSSVTIDDKNAAYRLTTTIIKEGRRRILFLGPNTGIKVARDRFEGYKKALADHGIEFDQELVLHSFRNVVDSHKKILSLIDEKKKFDAIVSIGGLITYGAGKAILERNLRIPEDVILGEFGDNDVVARLKSSFYTVFQNPYKIGKVSVDLLIKMIEEGRENTKKIDVVIESEILQR